MPTVLLVLLRTIGLICRGHRAVALENLALRYRGGIRETRPHAFAAQQHHAESLIGHAVAQPEIESRFVAK